MKIILLLLLIVPHMVVAKLAVKRFKTTCGVDLLGNKEKFLKVESPIFTEDDWGKSSVKLEIGPYTLHSDISMMGDKPVNGLGVVTHHPELTMNIFEGNPIGKSIFRANIEGFLLKDLTRPLTLSGFQFRDLKHEKVYYSRMDYYCRLDIIK